MLKLDKFDDYLKSRSERGRKGVYFCRFIGFDDEKMVCFRRYQVTAQTKGIYIKKPINNPSENEVQFFFKTVGQFDFSIDTNVIQQIINRWFSQILPEKRQILTESVLHVLKELQMQGMNGNILKNAFVKFMCWSRYVFEGVISAIDEEVIPKILYEGDISKYELYMLRILSLWGCDVLYLHFLNEDSYLKIDKNGAWSQLIQGKRRGVPPIHFSKIDLCALEREEERKRVIQSIHDKVITNTWLEGSFLDNIWKTNGQRGLLDNSRIYNLYIRYLGIDVIEDYKNRLFQLKENLQDKKNNFVFVENRLGNPTIDETKKTVISNYTDRKDLADKLITKISTSSDKLLNAMIQNAFLRSMEYNREDTLTKLYNYGMKLVCWLNRYFDTLFSGFQYEVLPVFFYYGSCNESEGEFLSMLAYMPVDVIMVSPDKKAGDIFTKQSGYDMGKEEILPQSTEVFPFPQKEIKTRMATAAYNAERELDTMLYTGTGFFRDRQFTRSKAVTLKTTYEEIELLWREEAKYRTGFLAENGRVVVPNIFARICGVKNEDTAAYFKKISHFFTEKTIFIQKFPYISFESPNSIKSYVYKFIHNGEIQPEVIKKHKEYQYDFLSENTQDYILEKIQEMLDLKWIQMDSMGVENVILSTLLNLDKTTLRLIQQFDFTKEIPKVLVVDVDESMASIEDCVYILFLNLIGFDIAVFTPTGYRNIDKYISRNAFEEYQIGEYVFNLKVPPMDRLKMQASQNQTSEGFLNRLFGRGRN